MDAYTIGAIVGAIVAGVIIGAIPAITGIKKGKKGLAIGGFIACVVAAFIMGALLAVPVCAIFMFLILKKDKKNDDIAE